MIYRVIGFTCRLAVFVGWFELFFYNFYTIFRKIYAIYKIIFTFAPLKF